jgi:hypothetical protein
MTNQEDIEACRKSLADRVSRYGCRIKQLIILPIYENLPSADGKSRHDMQVHSPLLHSLCFYFCNSKKEVNLIIYSFSFAVIPLVILNFIVERLSFQHQQFLISFLNLDKLNFN